ncbi:DUF2333 family protein [Gallaecimonas kandeliae]|uniref:DUF2333 family protein n=1 Tax=Gallaecimonas kandeliae TaxID=3029055 RepID=UPI002648B683|nr:DUF2333 family protein [Gallaecimonas kandeliae]WKE66267.1 DUF2333 family protein [Gallaecimonas kandeliae]
MARGRIVTWSIVGLLLVGYLLGVYWSMEPDRFDVKAVTSQALAKDNLPDQTGSTLTTTVITIAQTLLDKPGGFISNDVLPPYVFLDNMPAWEFGNLELLRDTTLVMRNELSRSQSQSSEDKDLKEAQPLFNVDRRSWVMPRAESAYQNGINHLVAYRARLGKQGPDKAEFYARADNLKELLRLVEKRLGSYSQRLAASVGQESLDVPEGSDPKGADRVRTSWWQLDDVFYEARGYSWGLLHILKAAEVDFAPILENKHAEVSLRQIIRELESTQQTVWSPIILNGSGFGLLANHSLVMANYISRANAAVVDLEQLLDNG